VNAGWVGALGVVLGCSSPSGNCPGATATATATANATATATKVDRDQGGTRLVDAPIVALAPVAAGAGIFEATLGGGAGKASVALAMGSGPIAYRRSLAFYRLAAALGMHVVPAAAERRIPVGELAALLGGDAAVLGGVRVLNDGAVTALMAEPAVGTRIEANDSFQVRVWERWAASPEAVAGERAGLARDFVEARVLDYLAANVMRRTLLLLDDAIALDDNREAFPPHAERVAVERLLQRVKGVARFPKGLRGALAALDRARAREALAPGGFETWLVSPRGLVELDERRAGLLSLIEALVADRGEAAVLSL
jgi:hypothetical protein